jgi:hypothetical protein
LPNVEQSGNENRTEDYSTKIEPRTSEETPIFNGSDQEEQNKELDVSKGVGDYRKRRTSAFKKNNQRIRRSANENSQLDRLTFLRKNAEIRDLQTFKEIMLGQASGLGGLQRTVTLTCVALEKRIFRHFSNEELQRFFFAVGCRRSKTHEFMERLEDYTDLLIEHVQDRLKQEKNWRDDKN